MSKNIYVLFYLFNLAEYYIDAKMVQVQKGTRARGTKLNLAEDVQPFDEKREEDIVEQLANLSTKYTVVLGKPGKAVDCVPGVSVDLPLFAGDEVLVAGGRLQGLPSYFSSCSVGSQIPRENIPVTLEKSVATNKSMLRHIFCTTSTFDKVEPKLCT